MVKQELGALGHAEGLLRSSGKPDDIASADQIREIIKKRGGDFPFNQEVAKLLSEGPSLHNHPLLKQAGIEYRTKQPFNTEHIVSTWQTIHNVLGEQGFSVTVPPFDEKNIDIERHDPNRSTLENRRMMVYVPFGLTTPIFNGIFPRTRKFFENGGKPIEINNTFGWFEIEATAQAPYTGMGKVERVQKEDIISQGRTPQHLVVYSLGSFAHCLFFGRFFDDREARTWSRVWANDQVFVIRNFDGYLFALQGIMPGSSSNEIGARSQRFIPSLQISA